MAQCALAKDAGAHDALTSAMPFQLRADVHWCDCAGRAVFLDVRADRYFALAAATNEAFLRVAAGQMQPPDTECLQTLVARGILLQVQELGAISSPPNVEPPTGDWVSERASGAGLLPIAQALLSEISAARKLRIGSLLEVLEVAKRPAAKKTCQQRDQRHLLETIASASAAASYLARIQDRCLVRALAVHAICKRKGLAPKLVFGVIAHPFSAHCWVQFGSTVLVGGSEHARLYTPILVIE